MELFVQKFLNSYKHTLFRMLSLTISCILLLMILLVLQDCIHLHRYRIKLSLMKVSQILDASGVALGETRLLIFPINATFEEKLKVISLNSIKVTIPAIITIFVIIAYKELG